MTDILELREMAQLGELRNRRRPVDEEWWASLPREWSSSRAAPTEGCQARFGLPHAGVVNSDRCSYCGRPLTARRPGA